MTFREKQNWVHIFSEFGEMKQEWRLVVVVENTQKNIKIDLNKFWHIFSFQQIR